MGFQVTKTGAFSFQHKLANQNGREGRKVDCQDYAERMLDSFPSYSDIGTEKSKGIIQVEVLMDLMLIIFVVLNFIYLEIKTSRLR